MSPDERARSSPRPRTMVQLCLHAAHREACVEGPAGARLYDLIRAAGWPLGSSCRGEGICGRCQVQVLGPDGLLEPPSPEELRLLAREGLAAPFVIACLRRCTEAQGSVRVTTTYW